jgi:hypothetical protein
MPLCPAVFPPTRNGAQETLVHCGIGRAIGVSVYRELYQEGMDLDAK